MNLEHEGITERIIGYAFTVLNGLGPGFLKKVYENALAHELKKMGLKVEQQRATPVRWDGQVVGEYFADIVVEDSVIVEVKAAKALDAVHEAQLLNYLKATGLRVGLLLNFGKPELGMRRMVF